MKSFEFHTQNKNLPPTIVKRPATTNLHQVFATIRKTQRYIYTSGKPHAHHVKKHFSKDIKNLKLA